MSHHCPECDVRWSPHQTRAGCCPQCAAGTRLSRERADEDSVKRHRAALAAANRRELHQRFGAYCAERDARRHAA